MRCVVDSPAARRRAAAAAALLLAAVGPAPVFAAPIDVEGPVTITAANAEWVKGIGVYTGNVLMSSKTLRLRGERLEFSQPGGRAGQFVITLTGSPAVLNHDGTGKEDPPVEAQGRTVVYRSANQDVLLSGNAKLTRGADVLTGDNVTYNTAARSVKAAGGTGKQVKIVIEVPPAGSRIGGDGGAAGAGGGAAESATPAATVVPLPTPAPAPAASPRAPGSTP